jgi:hypothetical protein
MSEKVPMGDSDSDYYRLPAVMDPDGECDVRPGCTIFQRDLHNQ